MSTLLRKILRWLDALGKAFISIFSEDEDADQANRSVEPGIETAEKPLLKSRELAMGSDEQPIYQKSKSLLSYREQELYRAICAATNGQYAVLTKVRMGDFVWLRNEPRDRKFFNNQVLCKHVDFLLCDRNSLKPLLVIELDDSSHTKSPNTIESDRFKDKTFAAIGMPMLRVRIQQRYDCGELGSEIRARMDSQS